MSLLTMRRARSLPAPVAAPPRPVRGQTMVEYALVLVLVIAGALVGLKMLGKAQSAIQAVAASVTIDGGDSPHRNGRLIAAAR